MKFKVSFIVGGVLAAKAQADDQLHKARHKVKEVVHALHNAQDLAAIQSVSSCRERKKERERERKKECIIELWEGEER